MSNLPFVVPGLGRNLGIISTNVSLDYDFVSVNIELPVSSGGIRVYTSTDCFLEFGDSSVKAGGADSFYFASGTEILGPPPGVTHIAVKGIGAGVLSLVGLTEGSFQTLTTNETILCTSSSARVTLPSGKRMRLFSMADCRLEFGDSAVVADDASLLFQAGTEILTVPSGVTYIAAKRDISDGGLYISGVE